jgi:hypothetical protein
MMFPSWKLLAAASGAIIVAEVGGTKLAAKLVGPELDGPGAASAAFMNTAKEYAAIVGVGVATFTVLYMVLRA